MPHCPLGLYGNLLLTNWNATNLANTIIIGNSFFNYELRRVRKTEETSSEELVFRAVKLVKEVNMELKSNEFGNAFNDQYLILWENLPPAGDSYWQIEVSKSLSSEIIQAFENLSL